MMRTLKVLFALYLCLVVTDFGLAQSNQCVHCNMEIKDDLFRAKAISSAEKSLSFDAIECLVNYLKTNSESYRFGNLNQLYSWLGYGLTDKFSASVRLSASREGKISGADAALNPMMVTTANTANYGGELMRGALGANLLLANDTLVFGMEVGIPLYQNYNGIFMDEDLAVHVAVRYIVL